MKFITVSRLGLALAAFSKTLAVSIPEIGCSTPATIPNFNVSTLPNPFIFDDGKPVLTKDDWNCRRSQLSTLIQSYEAGALPGKPELVTHTFVKNGTSAVLNITVHENGKTISFAPTITFPSGDAPPGGWPMVIGYSGFSIPIPSGVSHK